MFSSMHFNYLLLHCILLKYKSMQQPEKNQLFSVFSSCKEGSLELMFHDDEDEHQGWRK